MVAFSPKCQAKKPTTFSSKEGVSDEKIIPRGLIQEKGSSIDLGISRARETFT